MAGMGRDDAVCREEAWKWGRVPGTGRLLEPHCATTHDTLHTTFAAHQRGLFVNLGGEQTRAPTEAFGFAK
jgi:hypothetical protein